MPQLSTLVFLTPLYHSPATNFLIFFAFCVFVVFLSKELSVAANQSRPEVSCLLPNMIITSVTWRGMAAKNDLIPCFPPAYRWRFAHRVVGICVLTLPTDSFVYTLAYRSVERDMVPEWVISNGKPLSKGIHSTSATHHGSIIIQEDTWRVCKLKVFRGMRGTWFPICD